MLEASIQSFNTGNNDGFVSVFGRNIIPILVEFTAKLIVSDEEAWKKFLHTAGSMSVIELTFIVFLY